MTPARFTLLHAVLACIAYGIAASLLFLVTFLGSDQQENRPVLAAATALSAPLGPFTAGIARHNQSCCVRFAAACLPYTLPFLLAALLTLLARSTDPAFRIATYIAWTGGLFAWFASGLYPLIAHSLN